MLHYTARNGTTFHFDPQACEVQVIGSDHEGPPLPLDVDDLREFLEHLDDGPHTLTHLEMDHQADTAAMGPD